MNDEHDPKVSAVYRELGAEEPPRALDDAVLAAARRAAGARPGLRGRSGPNRWYAPVAAAAVLMLAVAVTLHMQVEQPDIAAPVPRAEVAKQAVKDAVKPGIPKSVELSRRSEPEPFPAKEKRVMAARQTPVAPQAAAPAPAPPAALASRADETRGSETGVAAAPAPQAAPAQTPERELERIAELRGRGRHDEADKALAEFRKRYPDFKISEEMRARVERH